MKNEGIIKISTIYPEGEHIVCAKLKIKDTVCLMGPNG